MKQTFGIDISTWQGGLNFEDVKNEGVEFVMIRAGYTGSIDGVSKAVDNQFVTFYNSAKVYGLKVGTYWFSRATTYEQGRDEAKYMYNNCLKGRQFEYPIAIDVEDTVYQAFAGKTAVTEEIKGFCEYLEGKGYYVSIYANANWFKNYIDVANLSMYDKWIASWGMSKPLYCEAGIWQFGGESNYIRSNKIAGMIIDQNFAYKDYPNIIISKGLNGYGKNSNSDYGETTSDISYIVKKGDTLSSIAKKYNMTYKILANYNEISNPDLIYVGQIIKIPFQINYCIYIVQKGDTLSSIAKNYNTTYQKIAYDNNIYNPDLIKVGQQLIIKY